MCFCWQWIFLIVMCIVYILCATSGEGRASPLNGSNKCWGGGGNLTGEEDWGGWGGGAASPPPFEAFQSLPFYNGWHIFWESKNHWQLKNLSSKCKLPLPKKVYCFKPPCRPPDHMAQHSNRQDSTEFQNNYISKRWHLKISKYELQKNCDCQKKALEKEN